MAFRSGEFSLLAFCLVVTQWKKLAVLGVASLLGVGYCAGRAVTSHEAPAPAAITSSEIQKFYNHRAREAFGSLGLKPSKDTLDFGKTPACGDDNGSVFAATTAAGKSVEGAVCMTKAGQAKITITP